MIQGMHMIIYIYVYIYMISMYLWTLCLGVDSAHGHMCAPWSVCLCLHACI